MRFGTILASVLAFAAGAAHAQYSNDVIKIGVLTDLNGVYSALAGPGSVKAAEMAAEDFMKAHKQFAGKVQVIGVDHQNKADIATNKASEMYDRMGVDVIVDTPNSACAVAVAAVANQKKRLFIAVGAGTSALTNEKCNKATFHYAYDNYFLANSTGTAITKKGGNTWFMIYPNYEFGKNLEAQMHKAVEANGGKLAAPSEPTPFPNTDFSSFLLKAQSLKPKVFGTMQAGADLVNVIKQYNEFGLKKSGVGLAIGLLFETDVAALGQDAYAGAEATVPWFRGFDAKSRAWGDRFEKEFGKSPSFDQAGVFSAVSTYLQAVARAKSDEPEKVIAQLEGHKFEDFFARHASIRKEDHRVILDGYLVEVKAKSAAKEPWDFYKLVSVTPAEQAFTPLSESKCKMAELGK